MSTPQNPSTEAPCVSLYELALEVSSLLWGWTACVHTRTGEIGTYGEDDMGDDEIAEDFARYEEDGWHHLHHYPDHDSDARTMEDFALGLDDEDLTHALLRALSGRKPFSTFRNVARTHGLLERWDEAHTEALARELRRELAGTGLRFAEDAER